jgi:polyketide synthase PksL
MIDFVEYVVSELKSKKLSKNDALALIKQFALRSSVGTKTFYIHPLLHRNTSDLSCQKYSTTLTGEEFFLKDHQVQDQKILPAVAYLEMARAAVETAIAFKKESSILELRNVVWVQPIVVEDQKEINIALSPTDGCLNADVKIDFEIYSTDGEKEIVHCQGQAVCIQRITLPKIDIVRLKGETTKGKLQASEIYPVFKKMGANFGPSHQGIETVFQGDNQVVSVLRLPTAVELVEKDYLLHPSLMDSALQSSIGLYGDINKLKPQPLLPFALDTLSVISACTKEMFAWVRYSDGSRPGDKLEKMDVDLCDGEGNICVQMKGYCSRVLSTNIITTGELEKQDKQFGTLLATPVWQSTEIGSSNEKASLFVQQHIILCDIPNVNAAQLESVLVNSKCHLLPIAKQLNISDRFSNYALACFEGLQSIIKSKQEGRVLVQIVIPDSQEESMFAGLNGLLQSATLENPNLQGQIIFINRQTTADKLAEQLLHDQCRPQDTIVQYKPSSRNILRWEIISESQNKPAIAFKDRGVYLITGGLGGLAVLFAKEILQQTSTSRIILTGRSSVADLKEKQSVLANLLAIRNDIEYRQLDIDSLTETKQFIATIIQEYRQLNGILHSAGMTADNFILKKTSAEFNQVLKPKVVGTFNLDQACQHIDLDFFVLFSSVASAFGNVGQADYASANGFMDQFAGYRNNLMTAKQRRGKTLAVNWPLWLEGGMSPHQTTKEFLQQTTGMYAMKTLTGMQAFYRALELPYSQVLVLEGDLPKLSALLTEQKIETKTLSSQPQQVVAIKGSSEINTNSLADETQAYLIKQFSLVLRMPSHKINAKEPLEKYGIDSILSMKLTNQLEMTFGSLPKTLFFEYQTIHELTGYFIKSYADTLAILFAKESNKVNAVKSEDKKPKSIPPIQPRKILCKRFIRERHSETTSTNAINTEPIAIVGLSGRYPEATNIQQYWNNLRNGKDCITEVPKQRWDWREYYSEDRDKDGHHYSKWGGFISGVDEFDPRFFNISPREAEFIDPQERLFLQHAWMAVEDAGYNRASLQIPHENGLAGQVGVYVGVMYSEYQLFGIESSMSGKRISIPGSYASIANRVSYVLNLHGPSMTLDTMCSSSLAAIHLACQDLKLGRTSLAIAGGVNVSIHPNKYLFLSAGQFVSTDGHCQSFGEGGDGYIPGEGVGVVVLKKLSEAVRDGNHIYGVIKGSALNHGGKTNGYSVPNPNAQTSVISMALAESKIDRRHVSYIEAHGTGTKLGDPIEIAALSKAFQQHTEETGYCLLGSAKSNIGHCESAAGIAGLTKVLLQMKYQQIVPSLHSKILNPYIDFQKTPFVVNQTLRAWDRPVIDGQQLPRIAGISAFGAGGANAHLVVQEYIPQTEGRHSINVIEPGVEIIFPLSARTADQLKQRAIDLLDFIQTSQPDLVAMAYTLQVGREVMEERVGFIARTMDQLCKKLEAYINGEQDIENVFQGQMKNNKGILSSISADSDFEETLNKWIAGKKLSKVLELWVNGFELDWNKFYNDAKPARISLPTYPFAKEKYWIDIKTAGVVAVERTTTVLHPLLHTNTSSFNQQRYNSVFSGNEFFLKDHQISLGSDAVEKMLSAAVFLEMIRAAVDQASQTQQHLKILELHNVTWGQPAVVKENKQISIVLFADDDDQYEYEIFSEENEQEIVHCVGQAVYSDRTASVKVDIEKLKLQMRHGRLESDVLYPNFAAMGLNYGPAHRGIISVSRGENQLLAQLRLPTVVEANQTDYTLHPSLLDSVLQASVCLITDFNQRQNYPTLPFALDSLSVVLPCTKEMFAWVRHAQAHQMDNKISKLDIDLFDLQGNVCVHLKGLFLQQISISASTLISPSFVINKPQTIQLNGSHEMKASVTEKPQAIRLMDVQDGDVSFADPTSRPKTVQLSDSHKTPVVENTISLNSSLKIITVTNNTSDKLSLSTVDGSLQSTPSKGYSKSQLQEYLRTSLAEALYLNPSEIDINKSFVDLGLDSIIGVEWIKVINRNFRLEISATKVYDYSTIRAFASFLFKELDNTNGPSNGVRTNELSFSESSVTVD